MATLVLVHGACHACSKPAMGAFDQFAARLLGDRGWRFHDLAGHDAMATAPGPLVKILLGR